MSESEPTLVKPLILGGFGAEEPADEEIQKMIDILQEDVKAKTGKKEHANFKALKYRSQACAGRNYIVKVDVGDQHLHVKFHQPLSYTGKNPELMDLQIDKKLEDELEDF